MENNPNVQSTGNTANEQEQTFTQKDVDRMISARLAREREKYPTDEEIAAYRSWKDSQQTEQERQAKREKELLDAKAALEGANASLEQVKREKYVLSKGLTGEEAEFVVYKAAKLVDEKTTFEKAVDKLVEGRKKVTFDWSASVGGGNKAANTNSVMNDLIRAARR